MGAIWRHIGRRRVSYRIPRLLKTMFQLIAFKGTATGWAPIGRPRPFADACRLMRAANAVNGDVWSYRLKIIAPELPAFI